MPFRWIDVFFGTALLLIDFVCPPCLYISTSVYIEDFHTLKDHGSGFPGPDFVGLPRNPHC